MADTELSLREQYMLEKDMIEQQYGGLEGIRLSLGLSQRQLCKLLLVDPSAFTRWNKTDGAPPHIYKALKWLLELKEINPQAVEPTNISSRVDHLQASTGSKIKQLENHIESLEKTLSLASTGVIDHSPMVQDTLSYALKAQEKNFEKEIQALREELQAIGANKPRKAKRKARISKKKRAKTTKKKATKKKTAKKKATKKNTKKRRQKLSKKKANKKLSRRPATKAGARKKKPINKRSKAMKKRPVRRK